MKHQDQPRNAIRMLAAIGVLLALVTSTALAVRLLDSLGNSQPASRSASVAEPSTNRAEGSSVNRSVVNRNGLEASPEPDAVPLAVYGS